MRKRLGLAAMLAAFASLMLPGAASAAVADTVAEKAGELDMVWVAVATALVFLMQAGFMFLEIGFSRQKNVGTGVAKILINLALVTIAWWAIGYGVAEGGGNDF
ncbi:MAG TPA: ammonium transporter, partial [Solirubrobacterales bacterium]|nr:ammonium transporter [Solirubrobacterales bacterium]